MLYLDSSILVALHCEETLTTSVRRWIVKQRSSMVISEWVLTECASAFGLKVRRGELRVADARLATQSIEQLVEESIEIVPILPTHFVQARRWLANFEKNLRAADALHLAVSHHTGCRLATYDKTLIDTAKSLKVRSVKALA